MIHLLSAKSAWEVLPSIANLSAKHLLDVTVEWGSDQEDLAQHLDGRFPGILSRLARMYVEEAARPLLEEALPCTSEVLAILSDPCKAFGTKDPQKVRDLTVDRFHGQVNQDSPQHVIRAMISHIELGLGDFARASREASFAVCEKELTEFGTHLDSGDEAAIQALLKTERRKAQILADLIHELRGN